MSAANPNLLFDLSAGTGLVGAGVNAFGQRAQSRYEASQMSTNARLAEMQAQRATEVGDREAGQHLQTTRQLIASQRVAGAGREILEDSARMGATDAQTIRSNAFMDAWGHRVQAQSYRTGAKMKRIAGRGEFGNTLLTAGNKYATDAYLHYQTPKVK